MVSQSRAGNVSSHEWTSVSEIFERCSLAEGMVGEVEIVGCGDSTPTSLERTTRGECVGF